MTKSYRGTIYVNISAAARRTGLSQRLVQECIERRLVLEPLTHDDLAELRRIRRLQELGANMPGIEIILHMRRRMEELQAEFSTNRSGWFETEQIWRRLLPWEPDEG
ncbi:MAG: hypothetical protein PVH17_00775 [Anaerolineae bacterium]|jgi:DNA-binding transcriptional MerR regulator